MGIPGQCWAAGCPQEKGSEDNRMEQGKRPWEKHHLSGGLASAQDHREHQSCIRVDPTLRQASWPCLPHASSVPGCMLPWVGTGWDVQAAGQGSPSWPPVSRGQLCSISSQLSEQQKTGELAQERGSGWGTNSVYYNKRVAQENTDNKYQLCFESKPTDSKFSAFFNRIEKKPMISLYKKKKKSLLLHEEVEFIKHMLVQTLSTQCFV